VRACNAIQQLILKAFKTAQLEFIEQLALKVIKQQETGAKLNKKPFYLNYKASTIYCYSKKLVSVLCYL
jgi:hypothetical protein